jgi:hypothetical protein
MLEPSKHLLLSEILSTTDAELPFRIDVNSTEPLTSANACYIDAMSLLRRIFLVMRREASLSDTDESIEIDEAAESEPADSCCKRCCTSSHSGTPFVYLDRAEELRSAVFQLAKVHREDWPTVIAGSLRLRRCCALLPAIVKLLNDRRMPCRQIFERASEHYGVRVDLKSFLAYLAAAVGVCGREVLFEILDEAPGRSGVVVIDKIPAADDAAESKLAVSDTESFTEALLMRKRRRVSS